jgi:hypothetical protein
VTQDRCCVLAFGPRRDRKASNAWAMRIPTLRTMKNTAMTSNIDGPRAIDALTKRSTFCTVKEIQLSELNFPPRDDFEQHHIPRRTMIVRRRSFLLGGISCSHANLNHHGHRLPPAALVTAIPPVGAAGSARAEQAIVAFQPASRQI